MSDKPLTRLEKLKKQKDVINARIQLIEARGKSKERKRDTRRKIMVGAYYLDKAIKEDSYEKIRAIMKDYLKRDSDRALFDLEPIKKD